MAKIKLVASGFTLIPEGWHTFKITEVEYKEDFGKMVVNMTTQAGKKHKERFGLLTKEGEVNEGEVCTCAPPAAPFCAAPKGAPCDNGAVCG